MNEVWNQKTYQLFMEKLSSYQDLKYRDFQANLGISKVTMIGVRTPILVSLAKEITKGDYTSFLALNTHQTYEEKLLHGLVIGQLKGDFEESRKLFLEFLPYIDNWAICDLTVSHLSIWKKHLQDGWKTVKKLVHSKNPWEERVGYVLLLTYYIKEEYIDEIFSLLELHSHTEEYYVKMAMAWLLSICYIKEKEKTIFYLQNNSLSPWIQNKAIQKIRESTRISKEEKEGVLQWKK